MMERKDYYYWWIIIGFVLFLLVEITNASNGNLLGIGSIIYLLCVLVANSFKIRESIEVKK